MEVPASISGLLTTPAGVVGPAADGKNLLRAFTAISRALNLARPLPVTLDLISEKVSQTMGHKACAVLLANQETKELLIEGSFGLGEEYVRALNTRLKQLIDGDSPRARSVTAQAYRTRMPVYAPDITVDPRFEVWRDAAREAGYKSIVALPLVFRDEAIGVLNCYDEPRQYTEDQVDALMVVAEQAASAVGIARLISSQRSTIRELNALNEHVVSQHELLERSGRAHEALTAMLLEDRSLDDITQTLSDLLGAPAVLQDDGLAILSRAAPDKSYRGLPQHGRGLAQMEPLLSDLGATGRARSVGQPDGPSARTLLVAPVDLGGHERGFLSAPLGEGAEEDFLLRTLEQASTVYALYAAKRRAAQETEDKIRGDFLADLVSDRFRDETEARERARHLGLNFSRGPFRVLVALHEPLDGYLERNDRDASGVAASRGRLLSVARGFADSADGSSGMAGLRDGDRLVALVPCAPDEGPREPAVRLLRLVREEFADLRVRVAVSAPCAVPEDVASRHEETAALLDLAERLEAMEPVACYDDWKVYGLLLRGADKEDLLGVAHRTLDTLLNHEADGRGDLLATLQAYLDHDLSPSRAAQALYVHHNTVKYRLNKISDVLALDTNSLDSILGVKLALMVRSLDPASFDEDARRAKG